MAKAIKADIQGRVQGVFFRKSTKLRADELAINGYVKNMDDGHVEVFAEGGEDELQTLLEWLGRGPETAEVTQLYHEQVPPIGASSFQVL